MSLKKFLFLAAIFSVLIVSVSCNRKFFPTYSQTAVDMVDRLGVDFNNLYTGLIQSTDKSYAGHQAEYATIGTEINTLQTYYSTRPNANIIVGFLNDIRTRFAGYAAEHRNAGVQNNERFLINKNGMAALVAPLHNAEINFKPYQP